MKPRRDSYLDFLKEIILSERNISDFVCDFFEKVYNELMLLPSDKHSWYPSACDHYKFLIWEMFVCTIAYLRHYEEYKEIHTILTHTYFLQSQVSPHKEIEPCSILNFRCYSDTLDNYGADQHKHSFTADIAVKRVKEPLITKETFAETDIFICQMSFALKINEGRLSWFPSSYLHANNASKMWIKLSSKQYCTKILPLFNAKSIDELKRIIQCNPVDANYSHDFRITSSLKTFLED